MRWIRKRGKWRRIGIVFENQFKRTQAMSQVIRKIYDDDTKLTPKEQQNAIKALSGITTKDMESIIPQTGLGLTDSIRKIISEYRGTSRIDKDKNR